MMKNQFKKHQNFQIYTKKKNIKKNNQKNI